MFFFQKRVLNIQNLHLYHNLTNKDNLIIILAITISGRSYIVAQIANHAFLLNAWADEPFVIENMKHRYIYFVSYVLYYFLTASLCSSVSDVPYVKTVAIWILFYQYYCSYLISCIIWRFYQSLPNIVCRILADIMRLITFLHPPRLNNANVWQSTAYRIKGSII